MARQGPPVARVVGGVAHRTDLLSAFRKHAEAYYRHPDGRPTNEAENLRQALLLLRALYGPTAAAELGPPALKAVRDDLIRRRLGRTRLNRDVNRSRLVFK